MVATAPQRLELAPRRSRLALVLWLSTAAGVAVGLWLLVLPWWLRAALLLALPVSARGLLWLPPGGETLLWDGSAWRLSRAAEAVVLADCRWEFASRWLVVLSFREGRLRRYRPVFADAVAAEDFRALLALARGTAPA
ncbi:MAG: hypothetical protein AMXMBFR26_20910 [Porticoccaceae bacterium]